MGRRKDSPLLQAAKGNPGRRQTKIRAEIEAAAVEAERDAGRKPIDSFGIPGFFTRAPAFYRRAIQEWQRQSDTLRAVGRRRPGYVSALMRYCLWVQIYESCVDQWRRECPKGETIIDWTPVNGTPRKVVHPSLSLMRDAEPILSGLEKDFGFTPRADSDLVRVESFNRGQQQGALDLRPPAVGDYAGDPMDMMAAGDGQTIN